MDHAGLSTPPTSQTLAGFFLLTSQFERHYLDSIYLEIPSMLREWQVTSVSQQ